MVMSLGGSASVLKDFFNTSFPSLDQQDLKHKKGSGNLLMSLKRLSSTPQKPQRHCWGCKGRDHVPSTSFLSSLTQPALRADKQHHCIEHGENVM